MHFQVRGLKSFILVITNRLQPVRDLLFRLFEQPVKPLRELALT
jgi:uncharacterized protein YggT (Ycf19 family)